MFKFNTTTIINTNQDFTSKVLVDGNPLKLFEAGEDGESLVVRRHLTFKKPYVKAIYKRAYNNPELAKVEVDLSGVDNSKAGLYRIAMYIRLEGSANEYYANDYVFKGKPFFIEFTVKSGDAKADIAAKVVRIAKKYMQMLYEYPLINVTASGTKVTFEATDEYQRFNMVELQEFSDEAGLTNGCCGKSGDFVTVNALVLDENETEDSKIKWVKSGGAALKGKCGFGTYRQIIKDLRLPTPDNRRWEGIIADETPIPGATYNQYTIYYCKKVGIQGLAHVGDIVTALTSHVFFVKSDLVTAWETALGNIGTITDVPASGEVTSPSLEELEDAADAAKLAAAATAAVEAASDNG